MDTKQSKTLFDEKKIYCRKLGHHLHFAYCRDVNGSLPCSKILDCWYTSISVQEWLDNNYSAEEKQKIFAPSPEKLSSILEIIARVKSE
jgi:hypothetical protein